MAALLAVDPDARPAAESAAARGAAEPPLGALAALEARLGGSLSSASVKNTRVLKQPSHTRCSESPAEAADRPPAAGESSSESVALSDAPDLELPALARGKVLAAHAEQTSAVHWRQ